MVAEVALPAGLLADPDAAGAVPDGPPTDRVARMRARLRQVSEVETTSVDVPVAGIQGTQ
jgi:hypothetical protein